MTIATIKQQYLRKRDFGGYLIMFGSHERFRPFLSIADRLSDKEYWPLLREVWTSVEVTQPDKKTWLRLFNSKRGFRELLMTPAEHKALAALPDEIEIWRGFGHAAGARGISWTLDRNRAEFFAKYACGPRRAFLSRKELGKVPLVANATCRKSNVLAHFLEREEAEIVVDPANVVALKTEAVI